MKKYAFLLLLPLMMLSRNEVKAQYQTALGVRAALALGLTVKHHLDDVNALEGIVQTRWGGILITGLYEIHFPAFQTSGLRWYLGGGAHVGVWGNNSGSPWFADNGNGDGGSVIGVDGIIGLEYTLEDVPINLSIDYKPTFNFVPQTYFNSDNGAISIRYVF